MEMVRKSLSDKLGIRVKLQRKCDGITNEEEQISLFSK